MLGELRLRRLTPAGAQPTVPLLQEDDRRVTTDSLEIMKRADELSGERSLRSASAEAADWAERLEAPLALIRRRVTHRLISDRTALREAARTALPFWLQWASPAAGMLGARFIARKYSVEIGSEPPPDSIASVLDDIRKELHGRQPLSALDIMWATFLQGVLPSELGPNLGPATRRAWTWEELAPSYPDLLEWRDRIYRDFRYRVG